VRIAFLGLGHMGLPMARNLLGQEHIVTVYNRSPGRAKPLIDLGAGEAATVAEAVKNAEVAITMLSGDEAIKEVVLGPSGLLQNLPSKAIHLCMSTIEVETSTALASAHAKAGQGYVAAPVFGRTGTAQSRHIWIVAGGPEPQVNRCRPIFEALGHGYTRVGPNAALAHALKLSGNMLTMAMELAVSEIVIYANKAGLPLPDFLRFLNTVIFRSHLVDDYGRATARPSFDPEDRALDLAASELLPQALQEIGVDLPAIDLLNSRLQAASARGWGEQDLAELTQTFQAETGLETNPAQKGMGPSTMPPIPKKPQRPAAGKQDSAPKVTGKSQNEKTTIPPVVTKGARLQPMPELTPRSKDQTIPSPVLPANRYSAMEEETPITLDLNHTSHFEEAKGHIWAWSLGRRYETRWRTFGEVELAFNHVLFLLIKPHLLLRPEAVVDLRSTFGGGARARVGDGLELEVSRAATPRLKELLGI